MVFFGRFTHMRDLFKWGCSWGWITHLGHLWPKDGEPLRKGVEMGVAIDFHCDLQRQHEVRHVGTHCLPRGFPWFPDVSSHEKYDVSQGSGNLLEAIPNFAWQSHSFYPVELRKLRTSYNGFYPWRVSQPFNHFNQSISGIFHGSKWWHNDLNGAWTKW